jgi:hypothetical protein
LDRVKAEEITKDERKDIEEEKEHIPAITKFKETKGFSPEAFQLLQWLLRWNPWAHEVYNGQARYNPYVDRQEIPTESGKAKEFRLGGLRYRALDKHFQFIDPENNDAE